MTAPPLLRWILVLVVLPALAWAIVNATFSPTTFEETCMRSLDVDTSPIACVSTWFLIGAAGTILIFQWAIVVPFAVWARRRQRRHDALGVSIRRWLWVGVIALIGVTLIQAVLFNLDAPLTAVREAVFFFCLPAFVLVISSVLLFTMPVRPIASDSGAGEA